MGIRNRDYKIISIICLVVHLALGFTFQTMFLLRMNFGFFKSFITVLIPVGFSKIWWDTNEHLKKDSFLNGK